MLRVLTALALLSACTPPPCGEVSIANVKSNPEIEQYRRGDGTLGLVEICTKDYGAFAQERPDKQLTTLVLDADVEGDPTSEGGYAITRIVLPAASVVFWDANLVKGKTLTIAQLAGSGLHKTTESGFLEQYLLTDGTIEVLDGPLNHQVEKLIDEEKWSEEWKLRWTITFGNGAQVWKGEDLVKRSQGSTIGSEPFLPPDPKP